MIPQKVRAGLAIVLIGAGFLVGANTNDTLLVLACGAILIGWVWLCHEII
jgi:hypothetical protein